MRIGSDTAMCVHTGCPLAKSCRRSPASGTQESDYQTWMIPPEIGDKCVYYDPFRLPVSVDEEPAKGVQK